MSDPGEVYEIELPYEASAEPELETQMDTLDVVSTMSSEVISSAMAKVTALDRFLNQLTHNSTFDEFARHLLITMVQVARCEAGSILEINHQNQTVFFRAVEGSSSEHLVDFVIPIGTGIVGHVIESRQPLVVQNIPENKVHLNAIAKSIGFEARNMIALPIIIRGKVFGVIELLNRIGESNFTPSDTDLLIYLSQMVAKAFEVRLMLAWAQKAKVEAV